MSTELYKEMEINLNGEYFMNKLIVTNDFTCSYFLDFLDQINIYSLSSMSLYEKNNIIRSFNMKLIQSKTRLLFERNLSQLLHILYQPYSERLITNSVNASINTPDHSIPILSKSKARNIMSKIQYLEWGTIFHRTYVNYFINLMDIKIKEICENQYTKRFLSLLEDWVDHKLSVFIKDIYGTMENNHVNSTIYIESIITALSKHELHKRISTFRAKEFYDLVADYPDSIPALCELRDSMNISNMIGDVGKIFRNIVKKRLLHIGASTSQILDMYVLIIKALRVIDSFDLLLHFVARPLRQYLMSRKDTVRCITLSLTDNPDSNLHGELRKGGPVAYGIEEDDEEAGPGENWMPRKRNPQLIDISRSKGKDILAVLVSIYGSSDIFVQEYKSLLAEKLLSNITYYIDQEIATVELLKIRFGEESMHSCEVMLHDIENSKRVNNSVASEIKKVFSSKAQHFQMDWFPVDYAIISENYWPQLPTGDKIKHHEYIQKSLTSYEDIYAAVKKPRKVHPIHQLGLVDMEIEFDDGTVRSFTSSPRQASIIKYISESGRISLSSLSLACEIEESEIKVLMNYWISRHVVRVETDFFMTSSSMNESDMIESIHYTIIENQQDISYDKTYSNEFENGASMGVSIERDGKGSVNKLEPYIRGLLSSHGSMSIERIHNMLRHLASGSSDIVFDMNLIQFRSYMQQLIDSDKIDFIDGQYRLHGK